MEDEVQILKDKIDNLVTKVSDLEAEVFDLKAENERLTDDFGSAKSALEDIKENVNYALRFI